VHSVRCLHLSTHSANAWGKQLCDSHICTVLVLTDPHVDSLTNSRIQSKCLSRSHLSLQGIPGAQQPHELLRNKPVLPVRLQKDMQPLQRADTMRRSLPSLQANTCENQPHGNILHRAPYVPGRLPQDLQPLWKRQQHDAPARDLPFERDRVAVRRLLQSISVFLDANAATGVSFQVQGRFPAVQGLVPVESAEARCCKVFCCRDPIDPLTNPLDSPILGDPIDSLTNSPDSPILGDPIDSLTNHIGVQDATLQEEG